MTFVKKYDGVYRVVKDGKEVGEISRNDSYARNQWTVERFPSGVKVVSRSGHDCFNLANAKQVARETF